MIRDTVVAQLARRLNNRSDINDDIIFEMQVVQDTALESNGLFLPWFLLTERATDVTDIGENRMAVPEDFIAEVEGQVLWVLNPDTNEWRRLEKDDEATLEEQYGSMEGLPEAYALAGDHFTLFPIPDGNYQIRMRYAAKDDTLANNLENKWLKYATDLVMALVGRNLAKTLLQNAELSAAFASDVQPAWDRLLHLHEMREHANQDYRMGGED